MASKLSKDRRRDITVGIAGAIIGGGIYFLAIPLGIGEVQRAGWLAHPLFSRADFAPKLWGAILILASLAIIVESLVGKRKTVGAQVGENSAYGPSMVLIVYLMVIIVVYLLLFTYLSFVLASVFCLVAAIWLFGYRKMKSIAFGSAVFSIVTYIIFRKLMYVRFPGIFF